LDSKQDKYVFLTRTRGGAEAAVPTGVLAIADEVIK
jgi:hypothetical protein